MSKKIVNFVLGRNAAGLTAAEYEARCRASRENLVRGMARLQAQYADRAAA